MIEQIEKLRVRTLVTGQFRENSYLVMNASGNALLIDPGDDGDLIRQGVEEEGAKIQGILLTHAHFDHLGAARALTEQFSLPCAVHSSDLRLLKHASTYSVRYLKRMVRPPEKLEFYDGASFACGDFKVSVLPTPGHTRGSVCLGLPGMVFTGDTLFYEHIGPSDPPNGDASRLRESVTHLLGTLPEPTRIFPGHGRPWDVTEACTWWNKVSLEPPSLTIFRG